MARKRSETCRLNILDATCQLLAEKGYLDLTIEEVASRAKAGKQTIYRHWGGKQRLALEAYAHKLAADMQLPDTGALNTDLQAFLGDVLAGFSTVGKAAMLGGLVAEVQSDAELAQTFRESLIATRRKLLQKIFQRAIARGELSPESDLDVLTDVVYGPIWYRLLITGAPLDTAFRDELVRLVVGREAVASR